jgi:phosphoglucosamine mutase
LRLGRAAVRALPGHIRVVVGRDTRESGPMLESALVAGLLAEGAEVLLAGVMPTPAIAFLTEDLETTAGVVISASHNPFLDNGIKFFGPGGVKLPDDTEKAIEAEFEHLDVSEEARPVGEAKPIDDAEVRYIDHLLECVNFDLEGYRVALDCANGAAYRVCPTAFKELGAHVETVGTEPDGRNINLDCGSTHPEQVAEMVRSWKADMGFALDGDADRCVCVDETGEVRDGDYVMAITARYLNEREILHPVVVVSTVMSNIGFYKALEESGIESVQTQVGDRYVMEEMLATGAVLGGEQSGHIIFREHASTGDGILTALMVAGIIQDTGKPLSSLSEIMRKYPQVLINVKAKSGRRLGKHMPAWGLIRQCEKELGEKGRVLVRSSGTEPVERIMVEAASKRKAEDVARRIADAILADLDK